MELYFCGILSRKEWGVCDFDYDKFFEKFLKKLLTRRNKCVILTKLSKMLVWLNGRAADL